MQKSLFLNGLGILIISLLTQIVTPQCCAQYHPTRSGCLSCPQGMHFYEYNCIFDIDGCIEYNNGITCKECEIDLMYNSETRQCQQLDWITQEKLERITIHPFLPLFSQQQEYIRSQFPEIVDKAKFLNLSISIYQNQYNLKGLKAFYETQTDIYHIEAVFKQDQNRTIPTRYKLLSLKKTQKELQPIDIENNLMHFYQTQIIGFFLKKQVSDLGELISGNIIPQNSKKPSGTLTYVLKYQIEQVLPENGHYSVIVSISDKQQVDIQNIQKIIKEEDQNQVEQITQQETKQKQNVDNSNQQSQPLNQKDLQDFVKTQQWKIIKDYLKSHYGSLYQNAILHKIFEEPHGKKSLKKYIICFKELDHTQWELDCQITDDFIVTILDQRQKPRKKQTQIVQQKINPQSLYKDFYYLLSLESLVNRSFNIDKYLSKSAKILQSAKKFNRLENTYEYQVKYQLQNGQQWQVHTKISKNDNHIIDSSQKLITRPPKQQNKPIPQIEPKQKPPKDKLEQQIPKQPRVKPKKPNKIKKQQSQKKEVSAIKHAAIGLQRVSKQEEQQKYFIQLRQILQMSNMDELGNAEYISSYFSMQSFTRNYHMFYQDLITKEIYEARVSRDLLRQKNYILSCSRLGY